jgi:hypothetical protein
MKYLSYLLYVLVVGYAIYSLTYDTHKSWYSWILNSLTGCIYTFGTSCVQTSWLLLVHLAPVVPVQAAYTYGGVVWWIFRVRDDDAAAVHQLQAEERGAHAVEDVRVQGAQHLCRRSLCVHHSHAHSPPSCMLPRWFVHSPGVPPRQSIS